jgi:hypothetical protein
MPGLVLEFVTRVGTSPGPGRYPVASGAIAINTGSVEAYIAYNDINEDPGRLHPLT